MGIELMLSINLFKQNYLIRPWYYKPGGKLSIVITVQECYASYLIDKLKLYNFI